MRRKPSHRDQLPMFADPPPQKAPERTCDLCAKQTQGTFDFNCPGCREREETTKLQRSA